MAKFQSPLLGYNNNVRHRGRLFHIQTEDSGVNHPHIITHVFMDGGRILKSQKLSYAEHVGSEGLSETVKQLMKEQHKAMFIALRDGQFDALVEGAGSGPLAGASRAPAPPPPPPNAIVTMTVAAPAVPASVPAPPPNPDPPRPAAVAPTQPQPPATTREREREREEVRRPSVQDLTLDFDALERGTGSGVASEPTPSPRPAHAPTRRSSRPAKSPSYRPGAPEGRYAPARPAAIFGAPPKSPQTSIFGGELFGDKSLDEVILSYLAEDLDPPRSK
jgi:hypothetical protein